MSLLYMQLKSQSSKLSKIAIVRNLHPYPHWSKSSALKHGIIFAPNDISFLRELICMYLVIFVVNFTVAQGADIQFTYVPVHLF